MYLISSKKDNWPGLVTMATQQQGDKVRDDTLNCSAWRAVRCFPLFSHFNLFFLTL